jgi:hypothetical protein
MSHARVNMSAENRLINLSLVRQTRVSAKWMSPFHDGNVVILCWAESAVIQNKHIVLAAKDPLSSRWHSFCFL